MRKQRSVKLLHRFFNESRRQLFVTSYQSKSSAMKNYILLFSACIFIIACNNKADQPGADEDSADIIVKYSWQAGLNDSTGRLEMKKLEAEGPDSLSAAAVIDFINKKYINVKAVLLKVSGDTMYLDIPEATYLTQQMGSSGPMIYFADAVYNLTEIPGIKYVNFNFEEGDHASPDVLNRESFKDQ